MKVEFKAAKEVSFAQIVAWVETLSEGLEYYEETELNRTETGFRLETIFGVDPGEINIEYDQTKKIWSYECNENCFLALAIPPACVGELSCMREEVEIVSVSGIFGLYEGKGALRQYEEVANFAYEKFAPVYDACELIGMFRHNGWRRNEFVQQCWSMLQHKDLELKANEDQLWLAIANPIVRNMFGAINDSLYNTGVVGWQRFTIRQFASLIVYMRTIDQAWDPIGL